MYKIVPLKGINRADWDAFADSSDEAWLWHKSDLINILCTWPGRSDCSFAVQAEGEDKILAILPLHRIRKKVFGPISVTTLNSLGGPATRNDLPPAVIEEIRKKIHKSIAEISHSEKSTQVDLRLAPMTPVFRGENSPEFNPLLQFGARDTSTRSYVIDLRVGPDKVWSNFEKRARTAIRKAEKMQVQVRAANHSSDLDAYYRLHKITYARTGATPHPLAYFAGIWKEFYEKSLALILIAEIEGEPVAAETFGMYKKGANYWTGAANEKGLVSNANSLLQWTALQHFIKSGLEFYDTGEAFPNARTGKQMGLDRFKRSFGGTIYPFFRGRIVTRKTLFSLFKLYTSVRGKG